jgi:hypothetical protein
MQGEGVQGSSKDEEDPQKVTHHHCLIWVCDSDIHNNVQPCDFHSSEPEATVWLVEAWPVVKDLAVSIKDQ